MTSLIKKIIYHLRKRRAFKLINGRYCGKSNFDKKRKLLVKCGFDIGEGTKIVGPIYISSSITIGKNCWIGRGFEAQGNGKITIGDNCDIAPQVILNTGGHVIGTHDRRAGDCIINNITIGSGCWIGLRTTVIGTVTIGGGTIIGACSLVNKSIECDSLAFGVPAKTIRILYEKDSISKHF